MAYRKSLLITGQIYHVFNRSAHGMSIFKGRREKDIFLETMKYYLQPEPPTKFSLYRVSRGKFPLKLDQILVKIISFCLMPNHFHFILRQEEDGGIRKFIQRLSNSFAHYYSIKYEDRGPIFEGNFKALRVETEEQLVHLSRYLHLNPVTAYLTEKPEDYDYSSYKIYLAKESSDLVDPSIVLGNFSSSKKYQDFVMSQKDYQRSLSEIKHLLLEKDLNYPGS